MRDEAEVKRPSALERPSPLRPTRAARLAWGARGLVWAATVVLVLRLDDTGELSCVRALHGRSKGIALTVCEREYRRTHDPATGLRVAYLLRASGQLGAAKAVAGLLLLTSVRADAWQALGKIASDEDDLAAAGALLGVAREQHYRDAQLGGVARDAQALASVYAKRQRYADALEATEECITRAEAVRDEQLEFYCHLSAADSLSLAGHLKLAGTEQKNAKALLSKLEDVSGYAAMTFHFQNAQLEQDVGHYELARDEMERAEDSNRTVQDARYVAKIELGLANILANLDKLDDAERHLAEAVKLNRGRTALPSVPRIAAAIAYRRGDLARASALNEQAFAMVVDDEDNDENAAEIASLEARIALHDGKLDRAAWWASRGEDRVEHLRASQSALELRPWVLSMRRTSYELRFAALAGAGHLEEAITALDRWHGRTLADIIAMSGAPTALDHRRATAQLASLGRWLPVATQGRLAADPAPRAVLAALGAIDLLALVVAGDELWCVTAQHGQLRAHDLGPYADLKAELERFRDHPTDRELAARLGDRVLLDGVAEGTATPLHVLLGGPLSELPVVALRHAGKVLVALRPVVRVARIPETTCVVRAQPTHATVLANARGDLRDAEAEARALPALLEIPTSTSLGAAATSEAMFSASAQDVLHVAVHGDVSTGFGSLRLHDRDVSALEIAARKGGPSLVFLSACASAGSDDGERAGSLAIAFLAAGSTAVVATLGSLGDALAPAVVSRFYKHGGVRDPIGALAAAQAELADGASSEWTKFTVFGQLTCSAQRPIASY